MREIQISACQFRVERVGSFKEFSSQVKNLLDGVPLDSDYVLFPELFTIGLFASFQDHENLSPADMGRIAEFTEEYRGLFMDLSKKRGQVIIAGSHMDLENNKFYNVCHAFSPDGKEIAHKKTHIFPAEKYWNITEGDEIGLFDLGPAKIGIAICYEAEIPEVSRIMAVGGADIIFCPSFTFTEHGFWRVRHCAQARCIENQVFFVHCCTVGEPGSPLPNGFGRSSILSPCDLQWNPNGVVKEAETNKNTVITGKVDLDMIHQNRETGAAPTFRDRIRRSGLYAKYDPYLGITTNNK